MPRGAAPLPVRQRRPAPGHIRPAGAAAAENQYTAYIRLPGEAARVPDRSHFYLNAQGAGRPRYAPVFTISRTQSVTPGPGRASGRIKAQRPARPTVPDWNHTVSEPCRTRLSRDTLGPGLPAGRGLARRPAASQCRHNGLAPELTSRADGPGSGLTLTTALPSAGPAVQINRLPDLARFLLMSRYGLARVCFSRFERNSIMIRFNAKSLSGLAALAMFSGLASAQVAPERMGQAYGMEGSSYSDPFYAPARDDSGVRLVVNGRPVDLQDRSGGYTTSYGSSFGSGTSVMRGPTLSGPTLTASAVGNNISISNVSNATIIVNAMNTGNQIARVQGRGG